MVIGVDPHKRINAVVVMNTKGKVLDRKQFANTTAGFRELRVGHQALGQVLAHPLAAFDGPRPGPPLATERA